MRSTSGGLTELVRGHQAIFLDSLDEIQPLRPEDTRLVSDDSAGFRQTRLYLETLLRRTPPTDTRIHLAHRAAIDPMPYQFVPTRRALGEPMPATERQAVRPRILIADGTGLGKTIEAGILLTDRSALECRHLIQATRSRPFNGTPSAGSPSAGAKLRDRSWYSTGGDPT